jgi:hypothetical protein
MAVGGSGKYIYLTRWAPDYDHPPETPGSTFAIDLGATYQTRSFALLEHPAKASFGMNLANIGPSAQYGRHAAESASLPTYLRVGWSLDLHITGEQILTIVNDVTQPFVRRYPVESDFPDDLRRHPIGIGAEYRFSQTLVFRGGYTTDEDLYNDNSALTFGLGVNFWIVRFDASWRPSLFDRALVWGRRFTVSAVIGT